MVVVVIVVVVVVVIVVVVIVFVFGIRGRIDRCERIRAAGGKHLKLVASRDVPKCRVPAPHEATLPERARPLSAGEIVVDHVDDDLVALAGVGGTTAINPTAGEVDRLLEVEQVVGIGGANLAFGGAP